MTCRRGDVILVLFPDCNLSMSERQPAVVVQADWPDDAGRLRHPRVVGSRSFGDDSSKYLDRRPRARVHSTS